MSKTSLGYLHTGDLFMFDNRVYRAGKLIDIANGYVACDDIYTHKTTRLHLDVTVEDMKGGVK